ncbi:MAG: hypothetical protein QOD89_2190 [Bradyrhizobium sp.]|jgi:hypothetical protein|nr:hypothetical protein [Bradyrhizobium sp.]
MTVIRDPRILVERSYYAVDRGNDRQRNAGGDGRQLSYGKVG